MSTYSVLEACWNGKRHYLGFVNYGESFPNYYQAKKFADNHCRECRVVREDRVGDVMYRYEQEQSS